MKISKKLSGSALKITTVYFIIGSIWILSSDKILFNLIDDPVMLTNFQTYKGWLFILVTSLVLFLMISRTIGLLKNTLERLAFSEEKFSKAFNKSPDLICISTFDEGKFIEINEGFLESTGYKRNEVIGHTSDDLNLWMNADERERFISSFSDSEIISNLEFSFRKKDGQIVICLVSAEIIYFSQQKCIITILRDITEKKRYEQKLSEEKDQNQVEFLKTLINTIPKPIFIKAKDRKYVDCNRAFEEFFNKSKDEIIGSTAYSIFPEEIARYNEKMDSQIFLSPGSQRLEFHYLDDRAKEHFIIINKTTFIDLDGSIGGIVGIIEDISEFRHMQLEINKALEKEKTLNNLKSRFISSASHEFRTPLTVILASADLLEMFGRNWKEDKFYEHTAKIRRTVKYMIELLDDVLEISRADTGKTTFHPEEINFKSLCLEIIEHVKIRDNQKCVIQFDYTGSKDNIKADSKLLRQILMNLLVNAVKYSPGGGIIKLIAKIDDNNVKLEISDQGIGIPEENMAVLFEPFNRGENVGSIQGTGLGLSIVKKSVELHNGSIEVKSQIGTGTSFYLNIPIN
ncbi:MAG: PAS domain S-box protein [Bacillota bacterium]